MFDLLKSVSRLYLAIYGEKIEKNNKKNKRSHVLGDGKFQYSES